MVRHRHHGIASRRAQPAPPHAGDLDLPAGGRNLTQVADGDDRPARDGHGDEPQRHEEQLATEEHSREEAVLAFADLVADDRDEPREHDPGERRQVQPASDAS